MKKILDVLGFKSVSALRKAVKNGDSNALEFLKLPNSTKVKNYEKLFNINCSKK